MVFQSIVMSKKKLIEILELCVKDILKNAKESKKISPILLKPIILFRSARVNLSIFKLYQLLLRHYWLRW